MIEFNPTSTKLCDLDAMDRFALALVVSVVLHLVLILGFQIKAAQQPGKAQSAMAVRIVPQVAAVSRVEISPGELSIAKETEARKAVEPVQERQEEPSPALPGPPAVEQASSLLPELEVPLLEDPTWYPAKLVDVHPAALHPIQPVYPAKAAELGVDGKVVLALFIDESGAVKEVAVVSVYPEGLFEESALAAFREARFAPAQKNGRAVKSQMLIRVTYELNGLKKPAEIQPPLPLPP